MQNSRVLIIDDDPIFLSTLASTLRLRLPNAQIDTVDFALASLKSIRANEHDVIICDGQQSGIEGAAFVRAVQKLNPEVPVLILIEDHDQDLIGQAMRAGVYDILVKPFAEGMVLLAVQRALEASQLRSQVKREEAKLLGTVNRVLKDLEVLYGAYGLQANFEAFMECVNQEKQGSKQKDERPPMAQQKGRNLAGLIKEGSKGRPPLKKEVKLEVQVEQR